MPNNTYKGERLSFIQIFSQKEFKIVVPIIQRDYAQGRVTDDTKEVRMEFLDALYTYLDENIPNRDLDFVYGTLLEGTNGNRKQFIPLDGQQRLTTLFLLHWLLCQISDNQELKNTFYSKLMYNERSMFTYETRQSSTDFCDALMNSNIDVTKLEISQTNDKKIPSLSKTIQNMPWFFRFWNNDPTVKSMLVMLDAIYDKFKDKKEFFKRLMNEKEPIITFIFMDLNEYRLTDDLYIKMNSRGKPLSKFENFKAKFEQYIKKNINDSSLLFEQVYLESKKKVDMYTYFSHNIDTKWTNMIWQYCKDVNPCLLDQYMENIVRVIILNHYATTVDLKEFDTSDDTFDALRSEKTSMTFNKYHSTHALSKEAVLTIINSLDKLYNGSNRIKQYISSDYNYYYKEDEFAEKVLRNDMTLTERIRFFAYVQYLIKYRVDLDQSKNTNNLGEWMRVVHNLTEADQIPLNSNKEFAKGIKGINGLLSHSNDIISHLQTLTKIEGFSAHQSLEECIKAHIIAKGGNWPMLIRKAEQHPYFNGQIGFILEFSGIVDSFNKKNITHWTSEQDKDYQDKFTKYSMIAGYVFDLDASGTRFNDKEFCFERAVLAHGNYFLSKKLGYYNILSTETSDQHVKRDMSWKRLLRLEENDSTMVNSKALVKETFDRISNINDIPASLESMCTKNKQNKEWQNVLVTSPKMFEPCYSGFICITQEDFLIISKFKLSSYHCELFTYHLWMEVLSEDVNYFQKFSIEYSWQKSSDVSPHLLLNGYCYKHNKYSIEVYTHLENEDFNKFYISFGFANENKNTSDYPQNIINIIKDQSGFSLTNKGNWYECYISEEQAVIDKINDITKLLP